MIEHLGKQMFDEMWRKHKSDIQASPSSTRKRFQALIQAAGEAAVQSWELPTQIVEKSERDIWEKHLYCTATGGYSAKLNGWEKELLEGEMKKGEFVAWLRNLPRRDWALCIPYELAGTKPFYPDFIVVRRNSKGFIIDILEPHDDSRTDTWAKAKGLAQFADKHGMDFGRLIILSRGKKIKRGK